MFTSGLWTPETKGEGREGPSEGNSTGGKRLTESSLGNTTREARTAALPRPRAPSQVPRHLRSSWGSILASAITDGAGQSARRPSSSASLHLLFSGRDRGGRLGSHGRATTAPRKRQRCGAKLGQRRDTTWTVVGEGVGRSTCYLNTCKLCRLRPLNNPISRVGIFKSGGAFPFRPTTPPVYGPSQSASGPPFFKPFSRRQSGSSSTFLS